MRPTWQVLFVGIVGIACAAVIIFSASGLSKGNPQDPIENTSVVYPVVSISSEQASSTIPVRLLIPKIHIDAFVEDVGTTSDGAMAVTKGPVDVAWFDLGSRPGEIGTAVIAGHEGWKDGIAAVFDNLHELKKGDEIYVENEEGSTTAFIVDRVGTYGQDENASAIFTSADGLAHLNLITCEGIWNAAEQSYSNRLVVFADETVSTSSPQK